MTLNSCTVAALPYDFTDEVKLSDGVFTVRFVAARLSPFKVYRAPIVRPPSDVTSSQESQPVWLSGNLAVILRMHIRLLLLLVFKITHTHTHIYFSFLLGVDMFMFLSSHGSSLVGLPFPSLGCLSVVFVYVTCAVSLLHKRVQ